MTQISRPFQIALVTLGLFVLVWFAALHRRTSASGGGSGSSPAASGAPAKPSAAAQAKAAAAPTHIYHGAAPGVGGLSRAIDKAHGAVAESQHEAHRVETSEPSASSAAAAQASHAPTPVTHAPAHPAAVTPTHVHVSPVPRKDIFVTPALQRFTGTVLQEGPQKGKVIPIEGGHWVVTSRPDVVARLTGEWVDRNSGGAAPVDESVVRGGPREVWASSPWSPVRGPASAGPPRWSWPVRARARW